MSCYRVVYFAQNNKRNRSTNGQVSAVPGTHAQALGMQLKKMSSPRVCTDILQTIPRCTRRGVCINHYLPYRALKIYLILICPSNGVCFRATRQQLVSVGNPFNLVPIALPLVALYLWAFAKAALSQNCKGSFQDRREVQDL